MSENKEKRTVEAIREEYGQLCAKAGHLQYQISILGRDLKTLNDQLESLNFEASSLVANDKDIKVE